MISTYSDDLELCKSQSVLENRNETHEGPKVDPKQRIQFHVSPKSGSYFSLTSSLSSLSDLSEDCSEQSDSKLSSVGYVTEWDEKSDPSTSVFVSIVSGNFLIETEVKKAFSRYGLVKSVQWSRLGNSNGYIVQFHTSKDVDSVIKASNGKIRIKSRRMLLRRAKLRKKKPRKHETTEGRIACSTAKEACCNRTKSHGRRYFCPKVVSSSRTTVVDVVPSPDRPGSRPSAATVSVLRQIFAENQANIEENDSLAPRKYDEQMDSQNQQFLHLPAPYHLIPNTPYFRRAPILPPPLRTVSFTSRLSVQQRIVNRYLSSMKIADEKDYAEIAKIERDFYERLRYSSQQMFCMEEHLFYSMDLEEN